MIIQKSGMIGHIYGKTEIDLILVTKVNFSNTKNLNAKNKIWKKLISKNIVMALNTKKC